jgi:hypothetical protein
MADFPTRGLACGQKTAPVTWLHSGRGLAGLGLAATGSAHGGARPRSRARVRARQRSRARDLARLPRRPRQPTDEKVLSVTTRGLCRTRLTTSRAQVRTEGRWQRAGAAHWRLRQHDNDMGELR